jgi:hypothetical protein
MGARTEGDSLMYSPTEQIQAGLTYVQQDYADRPEPAAGWYERGPKPAASRCATEISPPVLCGLDAGHDGDCVTPYIAALLKTFGCASLPDLQRAGERLRALDRKGLAAEISDGFQARARRF